MDCSPAKLDADQQLDWFVRLRNFAIGFKELSGLKRVMFVLEKANKLKRRRSGFRKSFGETPGATRLYELANQLRIPESAEDWNRSLQEKYVHYRRVSTGYVAYPYNGRITLIRAREHRHSTDDPTLGWRHVASDIDLHVIPGNHATCLTDFSTLWLNT